ncbi:diheme cytochrome c [Acidimangrovimonas pyrenivorans]|uniref:Diheme cytochrome c n=1 Tax=Acidimangrovimonas pyrenivorans TaxID=2030798 RepID=A0ABV7AL29_9RHOB
MTRLALTAAVLAGLTLPALTLPVLGATVPPVNQEPAKTECSACHMAYPPGLMPARSWKAIMSNLENHFGEDASLDPETTKKIEDYLVANAADAKGYGGIMRGLTAQDTPLKITDMPWWKWVHSEISPTYFQSKRVKSSANCTACHFSGDKGYFEED